MSYSSAALRPSSVTPARYRHSPDGLSAQADKIARMRDARAPQPVPGLPIGFIRSSLFSASSSSEPCRRLELPTGPRVKSLVYTGPRLGQGHAMVYQALMTMVFRRAPRFDENAIVDVTRRELLEVLGCSDQGKKARDHVWSVLRDLMAASIELETVTHLYADVLISGLELEKATGKMRVEIPRRTVSLFCDEVTEINLVRKRALGKSPLTLWLHDFLSSQSNVQLGMKPWRLDDLKAWSGSKLEPKKFRAAMKASATSLTTCADPLLKSWHINAQDQLVYVKHETRTRILDGKEVERVRAAAEKQATAAEEARWRRNHIQL